MSAQTPAVHPGAIDEKHDATTVEDIEQDASKGGNTQQTVVVTEEDVSRAGSFSTRS
jgi:hypothetical protein